MSETFNSFILVARFKPIVSMLEDIRLSLMERMQQKKMLLYKFVGGISPRVHKKLEEAYNEQINCEVRWNGSTNEDGFEVIHRHVSHKLDIGKRTCSCRVWELTGIPCTHAVSAILFLRRKPEEYVSDCYKGECYLFTYEHLLGPMEGYKYWDKEGEGMVLPPNIVKRKMGRPKTARRRDPSEGPRNTSKASRQGIPQRCSHCHSNDHSIRHCPLAPSRNQRPSTRQDAQAQTNAPTDSNQQIKRGRPRGRKTRADLSPDGLTTNSIPKTQLFIRNRSTRAADSGEAQSQTSESVRGRGRGRGRGQGRGRGGGRGRSNQPRVPQGLGVWQGEHGEMVFMDPTVSQSPIVMNESQSTSEIVDQNQQPQFTTQQQ